ncbi:MAG: DUF2339 domain-containing protein [Agriterribacter sp.]
MELMLTIVLFIVLIILIVNQKKSIVRESEMLREDIRALQEQVSRINTAPKHEEIKKETTKSVNESYQKPLKETLYIVPEQSSPVTEPVAEVSNEQHVVTATPAAKEETPIIESPKPVLPPKPPVPPSPPKPGFFERHPDLEKFIGENLVNKIGIAVLVLAIGFFVKYAIDNGWIGAAGRVGVGVICGGILIGLAHVMRKNYHAFSSVLAGGGLAVFYFTITLGFHEYHLFTQITTFIIMLVITAFAVMLSVLYNRQELAIIALVGGFATPFMASNGSGDYVSLFIYLIILNTGLLFIAYRKSWRLLNLQAFIFTAILFESWLYTLPYKTATTVYRNGFIFATVFYMLFLFINIAYNIRENRKFIASDFGILLANTCVYFSSGLYILTQMEATTYRGLFSAGMGIFNLVLSYILFRKQKVDTNILYLLIGITLTFISLTAPIQLSGNNITLFWASEAVLLYWLFQKSGIKIILLSSFIVWVAMLISLFIDWVEIYSNTEVIRTILANKGFITTFYASLSCFALWQLKKRDTLAQSSVYTVLPGRRTLLIVALLLLYASGALEINHQFMSRYPGSGLHGLYLLLYSLGFVLLFTIVANSVKLFQQALYIPILFGVAIIWYFMSSAETFNVQYEMLSGKINNAHFIAHWLSAIVLLIIIYRLIQLLRSGKITAIKNYNGVTWVLCIIIMAFISIEGQLLVNSLFYSNAEPLSDLQRIYIKTGLPIIWGLCSFVLMWLGMQFKYKTLRIISLVLFSLTLLKLFLFDIRNIPVTGKIAAFFCLGVLLLIVSFMYQRLKRIIIEDESTHKTE